MSLFGRLQEEAGGYWEIATLLREKGLPEDQPLYADWIRMYTSGEYEAMARWLADLFDQVGAALPAASGAALGEVFLVSQRYEYLFWDMAWRMEEWSL